MTIHRIATTPAELTSFGGTYSTDATKYDSGRTRGVFRHTELQLSSLNFDESAGIQLGFTSITRLFATPLMLSFGLEAFLK